MTGLEFYGGNFGEPDEKYLLFVGTKLGILGAENALELVLAEDTVLTLMKQANDRLKGAGFEAFPQLYVQWMPDA